MQATKLTPKQRELFEQLKSKPGGGIAKTREAEQCLLLSSFRFKDESGYQCNGINGG